MITQPYQIHQNDREQQARNLGLSLGEFDRLVESSNKAFETFYDLGPFYGNEEIKEPTFRVTAEPVKLPKGSKLILENLGVDLFHLARALKNLPEPVKQKLGNDLDFHIPPTWRIDVIISENGKLRVNEIEGRDGANALMIAEQLAYDLIPLKNSTAAKLIPTLKAMTAKSGEIKLALVRLDITHDAYAVNAEKFISFIKTLSTNEVIVEHLNETDIRSGLLKPKWEEYDGILNEGSLSPKDLFELGAKEEQLLAAGNYNALVNKGTIAILFDETLSDFWTNNLGVERFERLKEILIYSRFIESKEDLEKARKGKKVVKVSWAGSDISLINRSKGVALPEGSMVQASEERWEMLRDLADKGVKIVAQDFVTPARISAYLRKRGTNLEYVEWYNRLCVKYVVNGDPNSDSNPTVSLTAAEVTLGSDIVPAGRSCAFTAASFEG